MNAAPTAPAVLAAVLGAAAPAQGTQRHAALLAELDALYNRGSADAYLARFAAEQPLLHEVHARQIRQRLAADGDLRRTSELVSAPRRFGAHWVLQVRYATAPSSGAPTLREQGCLVAREEEGRLVPVIAVELPAAGDCADDAFVCEACNYRVGPAPGWLCVPVALHRTSAVEAATFLLLGTDLAVEVSVQLGEQSLPAAAVVDTVAAALRAAIPDTGATMTEPWVPPALAAAPLPEGLDAARQTLDTPDGQRMVLHASCLGPLRHLLLLRGSAAAHRRHAAAIAELLASYRLLETDADLALQAARALGHHAGGSLAADDTFVSRQHQVVAAGPPGWRPRLRCSGCAFQVVWTCPDDGGRLWVTGHAAPPGLGGWTAELADRWLADFARSLGAGTRMADDGDWSEPGPQGERSRELRLLRDGEQGGAGGPGTPLAVRLLLRPDLLVVADGYVVDERQRAALEKALSTVRRR